MASKNMETYLALRQRADLGHDLTGDKTQAATLRAFTPDVQVHEPPSLPQGGVHQGHDAYLRMHDTMRSRWSQKADVIHVWDIPEDDVIVLYSMMEWTAKATGRTLRFPAVQVLTFRDWLIAKVEVFHHDANAILDTLTAG